MNFDWKPLVRSIAPAIATALGGPLAGLAVNAIGAAVLGRDDASETEIAAALQGAKPEDLLKLKEADNAFRLKMQELGVDLERIAAQDRDSARTREATVGGMTCPVLAFAIVGGFLVLVGWLVSNGVSKIDAASMGLVGTLVGYVSAKAEQVVAYYFGSSAGSARKTEQLDGLLKAGAKP